MTAIVQPGTFRHSNQCFHRRFMGVWDCYAGQKGSGRMISPAVRTMSRLGMLRVTALMTVVSAFMSLGVAWLLAFVMPVVDSPTNMTMAFIIPFVVTPGFSYLTALSLRESRAARKAAFEMARRDPLTGVANRRAFFECDGHAKTPSHGERRSRSLLFLDIDHFKSINDTRGHEAGDAVLVHLARLLVDTTRKDDVVARFGGEEFVLLLDNCDAAGAQTLAKRILTAVRNAPCPAEAGAIRYTVSIGIAVGDADTSVAALIAEADNHLYAAKAGGRNTIRSAACPADDVPGPALSPSFAD